MKSKLDEFMDEITAEPSVALGILLDGVAKRVADMAHSERHLKVSVALTHKLFTDISAMYYAERVRAS